MGPDAEVLLDRNLETRRMPAIYSCVEQSEMLAKESSSGQALFIAGLFGLVT
jgi:hypothetical protein